MVYTWLPTDDYVEHANVTRLARAHGIGSLAELRARSVADIEWYWDAVVRDLGLPFRTPYSRVVDLSRGIEWPDWFPGGELNIADACLTRWAQESPDRAAVVHEAEDGTVRSLTFGELAGEVERVAAGLRALGIGRGDAVGLFLPMVPEAVVACYAIARLGAVLVPLFSGFAPTAIASRLQDADAKAVIVADGTVRRRRAVAMKPLLDEALESCPAVRHVVLVGNLDDEPKAATPRDVLWSQLPSGDPGPVEAMRATDTLLLAYTSGTTGKPKGAVHTHAGFLVKTASEVAYSFDLKPGGVFCWVTDMGWIMGPLSIFGTHANGGTLLLYEGSPDVPGLDRLWLLAERHRVSMLGVSPTLIRTLRTNEATDLSGFDLSAVHVLGSTGEPWDPDSYEWLARDVFGGRVPIINFSGGTEVGGSFLAPYPVEPIRSCSLGGPSLGMDVDVVDDEGRPVRGEIGELVCRQPWPAMTRGVWKDDDRYLEAYWSTFPGMWRHGDYALVEDGQWFIRGRSDDVMNIAGKRLAPAEVEAVMATHPAVAEAAAVGVPDAKKGEAVWAFWVPRPGAGEDVSAKLREMVAEELGKPFAPAVVHRVAQLPKTRSAKILRRAVRAAVLGTDPGDLSGAENPEAVGEIRALVGS
ncbi:AMP-binding protein [Amycolatopsis thermoflava]|uniref:acetate--CoA ligase n=1 Tax=Amycolatopsis thermoflava TaxID=84480 RepID=A0A3N2G685_9PSEU|nr:AMP-binding protein [Amycolatopsis thermoflava]ROS32067.1 acetyl-CoA synthetase [Amycolatopsis thermoflava]